ncbi:MAG TPA: NUDIX hydrolase [Acidimicrobiales bacterium]|nr:NUDIX hydrolase [Acidimicrobiales bacterium]
MSARPSRARRPKQPRPEVRAAGGVIWRAITVADEAGATRPSGEIVLVHRPRYDDWSFPKGKLNRGEAYRRAALREVREETGLVCEPGDELPSTVYTDGKGRTKLVRYWMMRVVGVQPWAPNSEVDERRWVPIDEAGGMLTYAHDREMLAELAGTLADRPSGPPGAS